MSTDSSPIVSPAFTARQWNAGSNHRDFRRSPAAPRARASMLSQPSSSSLFDKCPAQEDAAFIICSPPFRGGVLQSPLDKIKDNEMESLTSSAWLSPLIRSPVNDRFYSAEPRPRCLDAKPRCDLDAASMHAPRCGLDAASTPVSTRPRRGLDAASTPSLDSLD